MEFTFQISQEFFKSFPNYKVGGLLITGLKTKKEHANTIENIAHNLVDDTLIKRASYFEKSANAIGWKKIFETMGLTGEYVASHVALTKRVIKSKKFIHVNDIVDLYNIISLYRFIPLGGHAIKSISNVTVGLTNGGEAFKSIGSNDEVKVEKGEFAYLDTEHKRVLTRNLVWRQADYSKVTPECGEMFIPIDDGIGQLSNEMLEEIAGELIGLFSIFYDFDYSFGIASKHNPIIDFGGKLVKPEVKPPLFLLASAKVITDDKEINKFFDRKLADIFPSKDEFEKALKSGRRLKFYMGADCTAPRLHIGHMIPFMKMAELQKLGHQVIFLIGDFTGRIGDPTDKSSARVQLTPDEVAKNAAEFKKQVAKIIDFESKENPGIFVFNSKWNEQLRFQDVIELCTNFTVQQMLERDMFAKRMKENKPIYLHEFMYPLMQGYDSVYMEVDGEFGGKDQTFNMLAGRHLLQNIKQMDKFVITVPTLLSSDGVTKMSKSIGNCIFLTDTPEDKFGKIMAIPDNLIEHYYQLVTNLSDIEILAIKSRIADGHLTPMDAKKQLGFILVKSLDGEVAAKIAQDFFEKTIQAGQAPDDTPSTKRSAVVKGVGLKPLVKDLVTFLKLAPSNSEAKRLISAGAVEINDEKVQDINATTEVNKIKLVKVGKRGWHKLTD